MRTYLNFDLLVTRDGDGYRARVLDSPVGQATGAFALPFSELELENYLLRLGRPRRGSRRELGPLTGSETETVKTFGGRLFEAVFDDEVRSCWQSSLHEAEQRGAGLRLRLRLAPELAGLPWEYLYHAGLNRFYSLSDGTPVVRYLDLPEPSRPLVVAPPLRVLVMVSSPDGYPLLDAELEWSKLRGALSDLEERGMVALTRIEDATLQSLQNLLREEEFHVFHFIGHGGAGSQGRGGMLLFEDEANRGRPVSGESLGVVLRDHRTLRLAVLNACEGARTDRDDPFSGTAQSLLQQGLPAVIAMQFEISDAAAITLAHEFYASLADGYPVDAALVQARKAIFGQGNEMEWGTPVLYLRAPDGVIFDVDVDAYSAPVPEASRPLSPRPILEWIVGAAVLLTAGFWGGFYLTAWVLEAVIPKGSALAGYVASGLLLALALVLARRLGVWLPPVPTALAWIVGGALAMVGTELSFGLLITNLSGPDAQTAKRFVPPVAFLVHLALGVGLLFWKAPGYGRRLRTGYGSG